MITITLITITFILFCVKMRKSYSYWKNRNLLHVRPWPFFGFVAPTIVRYRAYPWVLQNIYNVFPEQRYFGVYKILTPYLVVKNPDLIENIAITDFETFPCRKTKVDAESDPIYAKILFSMKGGEQWKDLRAILSTALSGAELRKTYKLLEECTTDYINHFSKQHTEEVELKDFSSKFTNDVIAATVFGYSCNSLKDPRNDFYLMTKYVTGFNLTRTIKFFLYGLSPRIMKFFKFSLVDNRTRQFYSSHIHKHTENETKPNLLQFFKNQRLENVQEDHNSLLNKMGVITNTCKIEINDDEILAQTIQFIYFGFKTVSRSLLFLLYELSVNFEIQEKLISKIDQVQEDISYESLIGIEYLDMVVSESLRKWPPTVTINRKSDKPFTIEPIKVWEERNDFDAGTLCLIPIFAIHRDFRNFPNPDVFDPERFSSENKKQIKPLTYIPFGVGARNCIGSHFALLQMKMFVFYLLRRYRIVKVDKSRDVIELRKGVFQLVPLGEIWIGLQPRQEKV